MVFPGERDYMAATERGRPKTLHNFSLPSWGTHRTLRCAKVEPDAGDQRHRRRSSPSKLDGATRFRFGGGVYQRRDDRNRRLETEPLGSTEKGGEEGIEEYGEKMISDLRMMAASIFRAQALGVVDGEEEEQRSDGKERRKEESEERREKKREVSPPEEPGVATEARPWNLRNRRAECKAPVTETGNCGGGDQHNYKGLGKQMNPPPSILGNKSADTTRPRFLSALSKKEIEEDFMNMMGQRPPRRPKKRPRTLQKQINILHPALYFSETIKADIYAVPDAAENRKR